MKKLLFATLVIIGIVIVSLAISGCNKKQAAKAPAVVEIKAAPVAKPTVPVTVTPVTVTTVTPKAEEKKDIRKKLVSCITKNYETVIVQDENINAWQAGGHGKKIQNTGIGGIMADLKEKSHTLIIVNRWFASTKTCSCCGFKKEKMKQSERVYVCPHCGAIMCRDMNAAKNILQEGLKRLKGKNKIAREPSEFKGTPGENRTSAADTIETLRGIARVSCKPCSLNQEARPLVMDG